MAVHVGRSLERNLSRGHNGILYLWFVYSVIIGSSNGLSLKSLFDFQSMVGYFDDCEKMKRVIGEFGFQWKIAQNSLKTKSELLNDQKEDSCRKIDPSGR